MDVSCLHALYMQVAVGSGIKSYFVYNKKSMNYNYSWHVDEKPK